MIEGVTFSHDEVELINILSVAKGELHLAFVDKHYGHLRYAVDSLVNRLLIERTPNKLAIHQLFRDYYYPLIDSHKRQKVHRQYADFFECEHSAKLHDSDPKMLSNVIYHLSGSLQFDRLKQYKTLYIDEVKPVADQLYRDKHYPDALKYYILINETIGNLRHDILIKMAICYVNDNKIDLANKFFGLAVKSNPRGAYLWAQYSIALSNGRKFIAEAIQRAEEAKQIFKQQNNSFS